MGRGCPPRTVQRNNEIPSGLYRNRGGGGGGSCSLMDLLSKEDIAVRCSKQPTLMGFLLDQIIGLVATCGCFYFLIK